MRFAQDVTALRVMITMLWEYVFVCANFGVCWCLDVFGSKCERVSVWFSVVTLCAVCMCTWRNTRELRQRSATRHQRLRRTVCFEQFCVVASCTDWFIYIECFILNVLYAGVQSCVCLHLRIWVICWSALNDSLLPMCGLCVGCMRECVCVDMYVCVGKREYMYMPMRVWGICCLILMISHYLCCWLFCVCVSVFEYA